MNYVDPMRIVVVGRGTAGLLAALFLKSHFGQYNVCSSINVVYDPNKPIIGVGEGTTPKFISILQDIGIDIKDLVKNCDATIKNGIKFTNWTGDGSYYYHGFSSFSDSTKLLFDGYLRGINTNLLDPSSILSEQNHVPKSLKTGVYALHFDAKKLADYLENVARERGIIFTPGKVSDVTKSSNGSISKINLDTGVTIKSDFIIDCSGFSRVFIKDIYNSPTISWEKSLPVKRAMPFFLDIEEDIPPYTEAIAMKYGWMWKIPVGNRYGCGYVFDSDLVSDDDAYKEICEVTGKTPEIRKKINFKPEYHTRPLNENVLALGLSHGFIEPLEATSLLITTSLIYRLPEILKEHLNWGYTKYFNDTTLAFVKNCVDMVYFHYLTPRKDTEFWSGFPSKYSIPDHTKEVLNVLENNNLSLEPGTMYKTYKRDNFTKCGIGNNFFSKEKFKQLDKNISQRVDNIVKNVGELVGIKHSDFINHASSIP